MAATFAEVLKGAEADALCGGEYGEVSPDRVNRRNGHRERRWDTGSAGSNGRSRNCVVASHGWCKWPDVVPVTS